ncbi:uncharacterized protein LOC100832426 [Brachypodium distachyon]|uniref:Uncharacterized protein n=1 Tax=Brachypodium distachyon TaxID=15368 RepID=I1HSF8_BRADI|nr:uncharacterized protein LOC100832426 [Brachypodium distachyon]KQK10148.1 hypothetical protein BRADI_2g52310v3 [Brachypodium distachyon]|eukprot:XP_003564390.1 uncharacterized protein LOC100832426 [Brachypodium distachyon]
MGNCAVTQQAVSWADDGEWEPSPSSSAEDEGVHEDRHMNEVTIRISKRQLQELIDKRGADDGHFSHVWKSRRPATSELLADIMNAGEVHHQMHCRVAHWKPALQSIPEAAAVES